MIISRRTATPAEPTAIPMMAWVGKGVGGFGAKKRIAKYV